MSSVLRHRLNRHLWCALALVLLAPALLAVTPAAARNPYPQKSDSDPHAGVAAAKRHPVQGIDVSKYQLEIDWDAVKRAGTRFAFIKATEGGDHLDENFRENWAGAKSAGVPRGAYHFVFWCRPAKDQIRWFIRNVPKDPDALPPVLDVEWNGKSRCPRIDAAKARTKMREMLAAFEAHYGKKPVIYTDITFHEEVLEGTTEFDRYPFWIRSVAANPKERYENRPWEFWQFTATGRVPGIKGDVDRNAFYGSEREFRDWMAGRYDIGMRRAIGAPAAVARQTEPADPRETAPRNAFRNPQADDDAVAPRLPPRLREAAPPPAVLRRPSAVPGPVPPANVGRRDNMTTGSIY